MTNQETETDPTRIDPQRNEFTIAPRFHSQTPQTAWQSSEKSRGGGQLHTNPFSPGRANEEILFFVDGAYHPAYKVATHDETPGICKELNENGTVEAVSGDAAPHQETANSACEGDVSAAPADQSSAVNGEETKAKNPINWIQKKISMKKPRKAETTEPDKEQKTETPAAEGEEAKTAAPVVPPVEQAPAPKTHEAELQQPPTEETAVESKPVEPATDDLPAETGISEKLANLGIDAAPEQGLTNGHDGATNGHCVVTADGETMEEN
ncbi:unnamed protein product [Schistocephalus solidus]|uniref:Uncharacterized protein n=1 Tax=Schistocephalus solidus TaxID=70667 RepID=A0A183SRT5_SCHSO|nr:unnamed protein product [Schistocephalus solidus]